jgi:hypothetical protein
MPRMEMHKAALGASTKENTAQISPARCANSAGGRSRAWASPSLLEVTAGLCAPVR